MHVHAYTCMYCASAKNIRERRRLEEYRVKTQVCRFSILSPPAAEIIVGYLAFVVCTHTYTISHCLLDTYLVSWFEVCHGD